MQELQANTIATIMIGPFVDKGDGVTPEEGVTLAAADSAEVMKHDGTTFVDIAGAGANQGTLTHKEKGMYTLAIPAAVISDEGRLTVFISDESVCLPVWKDFMVLAQAAWISKYTAKDTGYMDVDVKAIAGTATPNTSGKLHVLNGDGAAITAAGPTNTQLNTAIALITDDLDNGTDGLGALKALIDAVTVYVDLIDDATNGLAAIKAEVEGIGGVAMRGTDSAALASSWTAALATVLGNYTAVRAGYLDELAAANLPTDIAALQTDLDNPAQYKADLSTLETRLSAVRAGYLDELAAANLPADIDTLKTYCDILDHATNGLANIKALIDALQGDATSILLDTGTTLPATLTTIAAYIDTEVAAILTDTNELQTDWVNGGRLDLLIDAIKAVTDVESGVKADVGTVDTVVDAIKLKTDNLPSGVAKNVALSNFAFLMVLLADHITPATGLAITAEISKDGGVFVGCTNAVAEIANGVYKIDLIQAEMNADIVTLKFTEATCDQRTITLVTS